jgi:hypothetical protein
MGDETPDLVGPALASDSVKKEKSAKKEKNHTPP